MPVAVAQLDLKAVAQWYARFRRFYSSVWGGCDELATARPMLACGMAESSSTCETSVGLSAHCVCWTWVHEMY